MTSRGAFQPPPFCDSAKTPFFFFFISSEEKYVTEIPGKTENKTNVQTLSTSEMIVFSNHSEVRIFDIPFPDTPNPKDIS